MRKICIPYPGFLNSKNNYFSATLFLLKCQKYSINILLFISRLQGFYISFVKSGKVSDTFDSEQQENTDKGITPEA